MGRHWRQGIFSVFASALLALALSGGASAGIEWSYSDPIFLVDGREFHVVAAVPAENDNMPLSYRLVVAEGATVSWSLPEGERLKGSVTIEYSPNQPKDAAELTAYSVRGADFPLRVGIFGTGLRLEAFTVEGAAYPGVTVSVKLTTN